MISAEYLCKHGHSTVLDYERDEIVLPSVACYTIYCTSLANLVEVVDIEARSIMRITVVPGNNDNPVTQLDEANEHLEQAVKQRHEALLENERLTARLHDLETASAILLSEFNASKAEIATDDLLLAERNRLLAAIPECPDHGPCIPYALDWVEVSKHMHESHAIAIQAITTERDAALKEVKELKSALGLQDALSYEDQIIKAVKAMIATEDYGLYDVCTGDFPQDILDECVSRGWATRSLWIAPDFYTYDPTVAGRTAAGSAA